MALICDTGPLFSALDAADPDHDECAQLLAETKTDLVVPLLVLAEVDYWCHKRLTGNAWLVFLEDILAGAYRVEAPTHVDLQRCANLQAGYAHLELGVVDASVIALAERLDETTIASLDHRHFRAVRPAHTSGFTLLP
ncbi:MAG TPA: PIN domain-containing protein [Acidimicrobiia bacterium]|nr:PIN domain-containing protein [Acidimicrobiia bacterium]